MGKLKPIGSEKLTGQEKINRMLEIARFKENLPTNINESSRTEFSLPLADGNKYEIVKEKLGYIIKVMVSESTSDYIEPMKNRKYYPSYSQALKRLNLLATELNRLNENSEGVSFFGEQKKFVLKTPKPQGDDMGAESQSTPAAPPPVPSTELPPSPSAGEEMPMDDMGGEEMPMDDMGGEEMPMDDMGGEETPGQESQGGKVTFKLIQKLTGKLTQKIRELDNQEGMTSEDIKYVINMVLSSLDLNSLSEEDKEDIMTKFEEDIEDIEGEDMGGEEFGGEDMGGEDMGGEEVEPEVSEISRGSLIDSIFSESKVNKVISKYFELTKKEIIEDNNIKKSRLTEIKHLVNKKMKPVYNMAETIEQEVASHNFLKENISYVLVGKTNKKNLVFESKGKQIKITPKGFII
jgi:hypothetical protein